MIRRVVLLGVIVGILGILGAFGWSHSKNEILGRCLDLAFRVVRFQPKLRDWSLGKGSKSVGVMVLSRREDRRRLLLMAGLETAPSTPSNLRGYFVERDSPLQDLHAAVGTEVTELFDTMPKPCEETTVFEWRTNPWVEVFVGPSAEVEVSLRCRWDWRSEEDLMDCRSFERLHDALALIDRSVFSELSVAIVVARMFQGTPISLQERLEYRALSNAMAWLSQLLRAFDLPALPLLKAPTLLCKDVFPETSAGSFGPFLSCEILFSDPTFAIRFVF